MNALLDKFNNACGAPIVRSSSRLSVCQESLVMLSGALTIYLVADLRNLARSGKASVSLKDLEAPIQVDKVLDAIRANKNTLIESGDYPELESRLEILDKMYENYPKFLAMILGDKMKTAMVEFVDETSETEMVHAITVNEAQKRITVIFRGSVTKTDFITDAKVAQVKVDNPVYEFDKESTPHVNVHFGFHEYLFKKKCPHTDKMRFDAVLDKVIGLLKKYPDFDVYATGHSLGGALCTLFGFYAAPKLKKHCQNPLRVVSIASPYVGNVKFLLAFQTLERKGYIQHLRIANAEDVVTLSPAIAPKVGVVSPIMALKDGAVNLYKHCGMKLHMYDFKDGEKCRHKIDFPKDQSSDEQYAKEIAALIEDGKNFLNSIKLVFKKEEQQHVLRFHSCEEYERRIEALEKVLGKVTLDDLYQDKNIVGDVLDANYKPEVMMSAGERITRIKDSKVIQDTVKNAIVGKS